MQQLSHFDPGNCKLAETVCFLPTVSAIDCNNVLQVDSPDGSDAPVDNWHYGTHNQSPNVCFTPFHPGLPSLRR